MEDHKPCLWCGTVHGPYCPIVKALEFGDGGVETPIGRVTRVEYLTPNDYRFAQSSAAPEAAEADYPKLPTKG